MGKTRNLSWTIDGGRLRERVDKRGRRRSNGYRSFQAGWVELRPLVVYVLDDQGKLAHASLAPRDQMFATTGKLLKNIEIEKAECVIIAADEQHWQWKELREMVLTAGVQEDRIVEVLDMCHALGRLSELSHKPARWKQGARMRWCFEGKKLVKSGDVDGLVSHCLELAKGSRVKSVKSLTSYFEKHRPRMDYGSFQKQVIPTGSGAMESMIRQMINMRLKGCGKFWMRARAERMLMLRSWWVVGRLEDLWRFTLRYEAR